MSNPETNRDEREILASIDAKLTALLSVALRCNSDVVDRVSVASAKNVGFLTSCGLSIEEVAAVLGTTKDSARKIRDNNKKNGKK
ncbi:MAG: hypothetical protein IT405_02270 [Candidatus Yanofskybacteria bacterium]|nr:hypothetical protein [Candidatus Yanofskybacteria bacterium]